MYYFRGFVQIVVLNNQ